MFDTVGMLIACADKTGIVREDGTIPRCKQALLADAFGTTVGAVLGTSTITTFVESAAGIAQGARTGLASVVTALLFLLALFFEPVFGSIPTAATAPILIIVGLLMVTPIREIDYEDFSEGIPAFLTMLIMLCASSVSDGIMFGVLFYVFTKLVSGKGRQLNVPLLAVCILYLIKILMGAFVSA
jgi:AGZA family xanthine/uracil permease-like MFS transporter